jgi:hypothetical protein
MKLSRHLMVLWLIVFALTASAQVVLVGRLFPKNVSSNGLFAFDINAINLSSTIKFSVTVIPKNATNILSSDACLILVDDTHESDRMSLDDEPQENGKPYHYTFEIASNQLSCSQFIFRFSDWTNHIGSDDDADSVYFFLRDFAHTDAPNTVPKRN